MIKFSETLEAKKQATDDYRGHNSSGNRQRKMAQIKSYELNESTLKVTGPVIRPDKRADVEPHRVIYFNLTDANGEVSSMTLYLESNKTIHRKKNSNDTSYDDLDNTGQDLVDLEQARHIIDFTISLAKDVQLELDQDAQVLRSSAASRLGDGIGELFYRLRSRAIDTSSSYLRLDRSMGGVISESMIALDRATFWPAGVSWKY